MAADADAPFRRRGTRAIQRMVEFAPSTGGLALWVPQKDLPADTDAPAVATDGQTLYFGAAFDGLTLEEQAGLVAHEVLHVALRHTQRLRALSALIGDVDAELFNVCADAIVNSTLAHLSWLALPRAAVRLDRLLAATLQIDEPVEKSLLEWDVERLYRAIDDRDVAGGRAGSGRQRARAAGGAGGAGHPSRPSDGVRAASAPDRSGDGPRAAQARALGAGMPRDLLPDARAQTPPEAEVQAAREWSERVMRAHVGDGLHSMLRALIADLPRTRTPWEQVLRTLLAHGLAAKPDVSWSRPSRSYLANQGRAGPGRRMPWEPGTSARRTVPRLAVVADVSGSIEDGLLGRFAGEIEAITRRLEASIVLVIGDDRVREVRYVVPGRRGLGELEFHGGGGTDFTPLLEEADRHRPDIGVVLTDLEGPARFRPRWPVIWAVPEWPPSPEPPFGRKLEIR